MAPGLVYPGEEVGLAPEQQADYAGTGADHGQRRGRPEGEHPPGEARFEFREALTELRVEAREVQLVQLAQVSAVGRVHGVKPVHEFVGQCRLGGGAESILPLVPPLHDVERGSGGEVTRGVPAVGLVCTVSPGAWPRG